MNKRYIIHHKVKKEYKSNRNTILTNGAINDIFNQTDSTSKIELYTLADAIENCNKVSTNWVEKHIKLIEKDINNAYGSLWEIIFGGILIDSGVNVILEKDSNPGIDVSANIWNTTTNRQIRLFPHRKQ